MPSLPPVIVVDAHEDIAWNALEYGRDMLKSAYEMRGAERRSGLAAAVGIRTTGLPEWQNGRVAVIGATIYVMPAQRDTSGGRVRNSYSTPEQAHLLGRKQMVYYTSLAAGSQHIRLIKTQADLQFVLESWRDPSRPGIVGLMMLMEGADPLRDPSELAEWHAMGLRMIGPAWAGTRYAGGTGDPGPLTSLGKRLLNEMGKLGMLLDLSHLSDESCLEALDLYSGSVLASHSNPKLFLPGDRGLNDQTIRKLAQKDGVVGILPVASFLQPGWQKGDARLGISKTAEAMDYVAQLTGSARHVGIGSDMDGGWGAEVLPQEMETAADLGKLSGALRSRGWKADEIEGALSGNFLRIYKLALSS